MVTVPRLAVIAGLGVLASGCELFSLPVECADAGCGTGRFCDSSGFCRSTGTTTPSGSAGTGTTAASGSGSGSGRTTGTAASTTGSPQQACLDALAPRYGLSAAPFAFPNSNANNLEIAGVGQGEIVTGFMLVGGVGQSDASVAGAVGCTALRTVSFFATSPYRGFAPFLANQPSLGFGVAFAAVTSLPADPGYPKGASPLMVFSGQLDAGSAGVPLQIFPQYSDAQSPFTFIFEPIQGLGLETKGLASAGLESQALWVTGVNDLNEPLSCQFSLFMDAQRSNLLVGGLGCSAPSSAGYRRYHAMVSTLGSVFVLGGIDQSGNATANVQTLGPGAIWTDAGALGIARAAFVAAADRRGRIYAIGGVAPGPDSVLALEPAVNNMEYWDAFGDAGWLDAGPVPLGGRFAAAGGYDPASDSIFVFMGLSASGSIFEDTYDNYDITTGQWTTCHANLDGGLCVPL